MIAFEKLLSKHHQNEWGQFYLGLDSGTSSQLPEELLTCGRNYKEVNGKTRPTGRR